MPLPRTVARLNRYALNPVMRRLTPHLPGFGLLHHTGRNSGRAYTTPINLFRHGDRVAIALTYGPDTEWVKNVLTAGGCTVVTRGKEIHLTAPELVHDPAQPLIPAPIRPFLRLLKVEHTLILTRMA
ncbi:MAG: nitroreductase family deazaflavin-dependent oxidoreductase [Chloroflexota bacterium]|nr:nitroreductase family deazaflavin-dependent oxidoreductase [Chloroflexota bacterium]